MIYITVTFMNTDHPGVSGFHDELQRNSRTSTRKTQQITTNWSPYKSGANLFLISAVRMQI